GQGAPDEELHGQVVDALGILARVGLFRTRPSLRQDVSYGAGDGFVALARTYGGGVDGVVEQEVSLVERGGCSRERDRAASVLLEKLLRPRHARRPRFGRPPAAHRVTLPHLTGVCPVQIIELVGPSLPVLVEASEGRSCRRAHSRS